MTETRTRSWTKSLTWRILGIIILWAIAWTFTNDLESTTIITVIFHGIRVILYYYHERLWLKIKWGKK